MTEQTCSFCGHTAEPDQFREIETVSNPVQMANVCRALFRCYLRALRQIGKGWDAW